MAERWITWRGKHILVDDDGNIVKNKKDYKPQKIYDVDGKLKGYQLGDNYLLKKASFRGGYSNDWVINKKDKRTSFMLFKDYLRAKEEGWFIDDIKNYKDGLKKLKEIYEEQGK